MSASSCSGEAPSKLESRFAVSAEHGRLPYVPDEPGGSEPQEAVIAKRLRVAALHGLQGAHLRPSDRLHLATEFYKRLARLRNDEATSDPLF